MSTLSPTLNERRFYPRNLTRTPIQKILGSHGSNNIPPKQDVNKAHLAPAVYVTGKHFKFFDASHISELERLTIIWLFKKNYEF